MPTVLSSGVISVEVLVPYLIAAAADLVVDLFNSGGEWIGSGRVSLDAGLGTALVNIDLNEATVEGGDYAWGAYLTPVGNTWIDAFFVADRISVSIVVSEVDLSELPTELLGGLTSVQVSVPYSIATESDFVIDLFDENDNWIGGHRVTLEPGQGVATLDVDLNVPTVAGRVYSWGAYLTSVGGSWQAAYMVLSERLSVTIEDETVPESSFDLSALPGEITHGDTSIDLDIPWQNSALSDLVIDLFDPTGNMDRGGQSHLTIRATGNGFIIGKST